MPWNHSLSQTEVAAVWESLQEQQMWNWWCWIRESEELIGFILSVKVLTLNLRCFSVLSWLRTDELDLCKPLTFTFCWKAAKGKGVSWGSCPEEVGQLPTRQPATLQAAHLHRPSPWRRTFMNCKINFQRILLVRHSKKELQKVCVRNREMGLEGREDLECQMCNKFI